MALRFRVESLEAVGSTNDEVKRALEAGEPEGLAVCARRQTGGYGRQGRAWASPEGGMYLSLLLRPDVPPAQLPTLSLVTGLAVRRALASLVTLDEARRIKVKWPNDVIYAFDPGLAGAGAAAQAAGDAFVACSADDASEEGRRTAGSAPGQDSSRAASGAPAAGGGDAACGEGARKAFRKLCGISLEGHARGVCVGIGVNVLPPSAPAVVAGKNAPAYLADLGFGFTCEARGAVDEVAAAVLRELAPLYEQWASAGFAPLVADYDAHAALTGLALTMVDRNDAVLAEGTAVGVDERGCLVLRAPDGSLVPVASGEAHIR